MGGSSTPSRTTQTTEPPAFIQPFMQHGAEQALSLYNTGGPQYFRGNTVVPFSSQTEAGLAGTEARALSGNPATRAATNYATGLLNSAPSSQFGGESNPYLDAVFNRGADAITQRLQGDFAASGRNIDAAAPVAADELGSLYAGVYAPSYERERDRMAQDISQQRSLQGAVAGLTPQLAAQDYTDLNALLGVGGQVEDLTGRLIEDQAGRWDFAQNAPQINLDNYISRISGAFPGSSTTATTPVHRNRAAGALGGAATGAGIASYLGLSNPWTAALLFGGGLLGGL